jgi:hypothetical protein
VAGGNGNSSAFVGLLKFGDIQFPHSEHGLHCPLGALRVRSGNQRWKHGRHHLPGHSVPILQPAAHAFRTAVGQRCPVPVHGGLVLAVHNEGYGFGEAGLPGPVQCRKRAPFQFKVDGDCLTRGSRAALAKPRDINDLRLVEDADVELCGLLRLVLEPEAGPDTTRHSLLPSGLSLIRIVPCGNGTLRSNP